MIKFYPAKQKYILLFFLPTLYFTNTSKGTSLHSEIQKIYNFHPNKISKDEKIQKSQLMDDFWNKIQNDTNKYLKQLRLELKDETNPPFFFYDGSQLLLSLTKSITDYQIALYAIERSDLDDIDHTDYVRTINFLAENELNTTDAALKIMTIDSFSAFIPQHDLYLDKGSSLCFMLLPINSDLYVKKTIDKLGIVKKTKSIELVLCFLLYTCNCEADSVILKYSTDKNQDDEVRRYAASLVALNTVRRSDSPSRYNSLVEKRKEILKQVSTDALEELQDVSKDLKEAYTCH